MKALGCILLLGASGWLGLAAVWGLKARVEQLRAFLGALEEMERELACRLSPMPELLGRLARTPGPVGEFFGLCAGGLERLGERSFAQLWDKALGAADLAGLAVGMWRDQEEIGRLWRCGTSFQPDMEAEKRDRLMADWHRAVGRSRDWAK